MSNAKLSPRIDDEELDELLAEITLLLLEDPSDRKAAAALVRLVDAGVIDPEVARYLYSAAVKFVYFSATPGGDPD